MNVARSAFILLIVSALFVSSALVSAPPILATSEQSDTLREIQNAEQRFREAFAAVREAEAAGAEENQIAVLTERLNTALNLIEQAKQGYAQGNSTNTDEAATQATYLCSQLKGEANQLRDAALTNSRYTKILLFSMVPVAALIVTLCVHYGLKWWRRSEVERVMKMEIKEREGA